MNDLFLFTDIIPPDNFLQFLLWALGGALSIVIFMWRLYLTQLQKIEKMYLSKNDEQKAAAKEMNDYKDKLIQELMQRVNELQASKERMISEIKPSLDASNSIAENVLQILRNGK